MSGDRRADGEQELETALDVAQQSCTRLHTPRIAVEISSRMRSLRTVDDGLAYRAICSDYLVVFLAAGAAIAVGHWLVSVIAMVVIAGRQVALLNLVHTAAHYALFSQKEKNDRRDFLIALPIWETVATYRWPHLQHHDEILRRSSERYEYLHDQLKLPGLGPWGRTWVVFIRPLLGYNGFLMLRETGKSVFRSSRFRWKLLPYWTAVVCLFGVFGWLPYLFLYWIVPLFWIHPTLNMWAEISDHFQAQGDLRNQVGWFYSLLFKGHELYHGTHHLYPYIPFYRLAEATRLLEQHGVAIEATAGAGGFLRCVYSRGGG